MSKHIILFQGDSITDGGRGRNDDPNHVLGHSYPYIIASKLGFDMAERVPQFYNRGVSGDRASDMYARWNEDTFNLKPSLISILIGVNDAWRMMNNEPTGVTDRFERAYRHVLEETSEIIPETKLVLCEPFILNVGAPAEKWGAWIEKLSEYQETVHQLAEEFGAVFVPLQKPFEKACDRADAAYWLWDGVHPTSAGHELIAREWMTIVQNSPIAIR
jgi:lysophospholipase L1-like esterase